jgi:poly-gamma-glutamate synthesis protein (capsule biosynthesis protein)
MDGPTNLPSLHDDFVYVVLIFALLSSLEVHDGKLILHGCGDLIDDYEGIHGHERWRGDLGLPYFAALSAKDGRLAALRMVPFQMRRMRLARVAGADATWLEATLERIALRSERT